MHGRSLVEVKNQISPKPHFYRQATICRAIWCYYFAQVIPAKSQNALVNWWKPHSVWKPAAGVCFEGLEETYNPKVLRAKRKALEQM